VRQQRMERVSRMASASPQQQWASTVRWESPVSSLLEESSDPRLERGFYHIVPVLNVQKDRDLASVTRRRIYTVVYQGAT